VPRVTEFPSTTTYSGDDIVAIVQGGVTKKITAANFVAASVDAVLDEVEAQPTITWRPVDGDDYTVTPASTSTIATDSVNIKAGVPIRYVIGGVTYYGIVTASDGTTATIAGPPLSGSITSLDFGPVDRVKVVVLNIPGSYAASTGNRLATIGNRFFRWLMGEARMVSFQAVHITAATTTQPKINLMIGANAVSTNDSNLGVQLSTGSAHVVNSAVAINASNYSVAYGGFIEINVTAAGVGATAAADLTVHAIFVLV
jgi:hypothetical protein